MITFFNATEYPTKIVDKITFHLSRPSNVLMLGVALLIVVMVWAIQEGW